MVSHICSVVFILIAFYFHAVGVVFGESSDGSPSPSAASSLLEDVQQTTIALYACCQSLLLDAGATLKGDLAAATKQIAGPLVQLIQAAVSSAAH